VNKIFATVRILAVLAVFALMFSVCSAAEKEEGLVGYWSFDEGKGEAVVDASGSGNNGTLIDEPIWIKGIKGSALSFAGGGDYVEVEHSESLNLGQQEQSFSISFWFKNANMHEDPTECHFVTKFGGPTYPFSFIQGQGGAVGFRIYDGSGASGAFTKTSIINDKWHNIVAIRDVVKKKVILYLDGKLEDIQDDKTEGEVCNEGPLKIGNSWGFDFDGCLDEVKIYNRLLTKEEIVSSYKAMAGKTTEKK